LIFVDGTSWRNAGWWDRQSDMPVRFSLKLRSKPLGSVWWLKRAFWKRRFLPAVDLPAMPS